MNRDNENNQNAGEFSVANDCVSNDMQQRDSSNHSQSADISLDQTDATAESQDAVNNQLLEFVTRQTIEIPDDSDLNTELENLAKQSSDKPQNFASADSENLIEADQNSLDSQAKLDSLLDKVVHAQTIEIPETVETQLDPAFEISHETKRLDQAGNFEVTDLTDSDKQNLVDPGRGAQLEAEDASNLENPTMLDSVISPVEIVETTPAPVEIKDPVSQNTGASANEAKNNGLLDLVFSLDKPIAARFDKISPPKDAQLPDSQSAFDIPIELENLQIPSVEDLPPAEDKHKQAAYAIADLISQVNQEKQTRAKRKINSVEIDTTKPVDQMTDEQASQIAMQAVRDTKAKQPAFDSEQKNLDFILDNLQLAQQIKDKQTKAPKSKNVAQDIIEKTLREEAQIQQSLPTSAEINDAKPVDKIESAINSAREKLKLTQQNHIDDLLRIHSANKQAAEKIKQDEKSNQLVANSKTPGVKSETKIEDHNSPIDLDGIINNSQNIKPESAENIAESLVADVTDLEKTAEKEDFDKVLNNALNSAGISLNIPEQNIPSPQVQQVDSQATLLANNLSSHNEMQIQTLPIVEKQKLSKIQTFILQAFLIILFAAISGFIAWYFRIFEA